MKTIEFNIYDSWLSKTTSKRLSLDELLQIIKNGDENKYLIEALRKYKKGDKQYESLKQSLPVAAWNVNFQDKKILSDITNTTGVIYFDKDKLTETEIAEYKSLLIGLPYIVAVWSSIGGKGIGCLARVENITENNFKEVWAEIDRIIGIGFDKGVAKLTQVNVISYDADLRMKEYVIPYNYEDKISTTYDLSQRKYYSSNSGYTVGNYSNITAPINYSELQSYKVSFTTNKEQDKIWGQMSPSTDENDSILFHTKLNEADFGNNCYAVYPDGFNYVAIYTRNKIMEGNRYNAILSICSRLLFLNPNKKKDSLLHILKSINKNICIPPLDNKELERIFNSCLKLQNSGLLFVIPETRYIIFRSNSGLTKSEKLQISAFEMGKIKTQRTEQKIAEAVSLLKASGNTVTQKAVAEISKYSISTIKRHWQKVILKEKLNNKSLVVECVVDNSSIN